MVLYLATYYKIQLIDHDQPKFIVGSYHLEWSRITYNLSAISYILVSVCSYYCLLKSLSISKPSYTTQRERLQNKMRKVDQSTCS